MDQCTHVPHWFGAATVSFSSVIVAWCAYLVLFPQLYKLLTDIFTTEMIYWIFHHRIIMVVSCATLTLALIREILKNHWLRAVMCLLSFKRVKWSNNIKDQIQSFHYAICCSWIALVIFKLAFIVIAIKSGVMLFLQLTFLYGLFLEAFNNMAEYMFPVPRNN